MVPDKRSKNGKLGASYLLKKKLRIVRLSRLDRAGSDPAGKAEVFTAFDR